MGNSLSLLTDTANGGLVTKADLVKMQIMTRDFAESRRTPFGTVVPKFARPIFAKGSSVVPAYGTAALIATYVCKANWTAVLCGVVLQFAGNGPAPIVGDVSYTVDVDRPLNDFSTGYAEKDFADVPFVVGSFTDGPPWPCEMKVRNGETVRIKATAIANMGTGAGNFFTGALVGFEWPEEGWE